MTTLEQEEEDESVEVKPEVSKVEDFIFKRVGRWDNEPASHGTKYRGALDQKYDFCADTKGFRFQSPD